MTKVEQARQRRADGRLRRLAVKQDEVLQEVNPQLVIEHIENQTVIPFNQNQHAELMAELNALPISQPKDGVIYFKEASALKTVNDEMPSMTESKIQRWIRLDQKYSRNEELNEADKTFWEFFQTSKKFGELEEEDAELKSYLAQRQG